MEVEDTDVPENELDREISVTGLMSESRMLRAASPPRNKMNQEWSIDKVQFNEGNPRRRLRDSAFDELVASIKAQGILSPLLITPEGVVLAGNRRLAAAHQLKLQTVPVRVLPQTGKDRDLIPLIENLIRTDLTPLDAMDYMVTLRKRWNLNITGISNLTGISTGTVGQYLRIADGPKAIRQMIAEDRIGLSAACALLRHADSELITLLSKKEQVSYKEARQLIAAIKNEKRKEPIVEPPSPKRADTITSSGFMFYSNMTMKFIESDLCDVTHEQIFTRLKELADLINPVIANANRPRLPTKIPDNRMAHPAIVAFKAATGSYPKRMLMDQVIETLGENPDVTRLNQVFVAWTAKGYNPLNLNFLEWYIKGIPANGNGKSKYETASTRNARNINDALDHIAKL